MPPGRKITPTPVTAGLTVQELVDLHFNAYNAGRLREACQIFANKVCLDGVTVGLTISGAMTPAGLGFATVVPLIEAGLVDWIVSTGANLYHDIHYSLGMELFAISPQVDDVQLRDEKLIRIYDIVFDQSVLLDSDAFLRKIMVAPEFQRKMGTSEMHYLLGKYVREAEDALMARGLGTQHRSILSAAYAHAVPIYTSSPGDSTLGMNVAALRLAGNKLELDVEHDVNESTAIVHNAKASGGKSAVVIFGGGSPKNFALQTEPQMQEILNIPERGHDYFIQFTDARPDTGGLSGATPSEAVTWGKIDPEQLPDTVVCYCDSTIAWPIMTAYALNVGRKRPLKRLYDRRVEIMDQLQKAFEANQSDDES
ncbi:MAG: deoxyhypusine synthase [Chloroflexota bacterium]